MAERSEVGVGEGQNPHRDLWLVGSVLLPIRPRRSAKEPEGFPGHLPLEGKEERSASRPTRRTQTGTEHLWEGGQPFGLLRRASPSLGQLSTVNCLLVAA